VTRAEIRRKAKGQEKEKEEREAEAGGERKSKCTHT
jgi:hypothetical protein